MKNKRSTFVVATLSLAAFLASCSPTATNSGSYQSSVESSDQIIGGSEATDKFQKENGVVGLAIIMTERASGDATPAQGAEQGGLNASLSTSARRPASELLAAAPPKQGLAFCTGSMISENVVLTAAHCLLGDEKMQVSAIIVVFNQDMNKTLQAISTGDLTAVRPVDNAAINEDFFKGGVFSNDIALLRIEGTLPAGFKMAKRAPAHLKDLLKENTMVSLAGFGVSKYEVNPGSNELSSEGSGLLRHISNVRVVSQNPEQTEILLDQKNGKGACHGDSGGPAYMVDPADKTTYLIGVTSRSTEKARGLCNDGAIYTSVMGQEQWINDNLKKIAQ